VPQASPLPSTSPHFSPLSSSPPPYPPDEVAGAGQGVPLNFFYQHPRTGELHHSAGLVALLNLARDGERDLQTTATPTESSDYEEGQLQDSPESEVTSSPTLPRTAYTSRVPFIFIPPALSPTGAAAERPSEEILRLAAGGAEARRGRSGPSADREREPLPSERPFHRRRVLNEPTPTSPTHEVVFERSGSRPGGPSAYYELT
jgi:hypothetical protein